MGAGTVKRWCWEGFAATGYFFVLTFVALGIAMDTGLLQLAVGSGQFAGYVWGNKRLMPVQYDPDFHRGRPPSPTRLLPGGECPYSVGSGQLAVG
jgi:hypothetical protein